MIAPCLQTTGIEKGVCQYSGFSSALHRPASPGKISQKGTASQDTENPAPPPPLEKLQNWNTEKKQN